MTPRRTQITVLSLCFLYGLLASCESPKVSQKSTTTTTHMGDLVESQQAKPNAQKEAKKQREKDLTITQSEMEPKAALTRGPRFTLSAQDVEVKTILLALGKEIKQNITIEPSVNQRATIDLKNVTLVEALDSLLLPLHLKYEMEHNFIHVAPEKMQTRVFRLNYIVSKRTGSSNVQASSGAGVAGSATVGSTAGTPAGAGGSSGSSSQRTASSIQSSEETDLWAEIITGLQQVIMGSSSGGTAGGAGGMQGGTGTAGGSAGGGTSGGGCAAMSKALGFGMSTGRDNEVTAPPTTGQTPAGSTGGNAVGGALGAALGAAGEAQSQPAGQAAGGAQRQQKERRYVSVNCQAGIIFVKDYPDVILKVAEFLEAIEGSVQRQVYIEAKILEVNLNKDSSLGIDWSKVSPISIVRNKAVPGSGAPGSGQTGATTSTTTTGLPVNNTSVGAFGLMLQGAQTFGLAPGVSNLNLVIDALSDQGKVSVLSSPKIAALNNQRAVIKVGTEGVFFVPQVSAVQGATTVSYLPQTVTIGIVLDVLPQIDANGMVMMSINTSISEQTGTAISPDGKTSVPILDVRESNNVVLSRSGQTIVIGGLMKKTLSNQKNSVPILGDIPFLGKVFQHDADTNQKTELVIMLTPQVMAGAAIDDKVKETQSEIKRVGYPSTNKSLLSED